MDLTQMIKGVTLTKVCSIKADQDSTESKQITLKVKFGGVSLNDVFMKALANAVIQWQNGPGRKHFDKWVDKQIVNVDFKAPARMPQVDPEEAIKAKLATFATKEEKLAYINALMEG